MAFWNFVIYAKSDFASLDFDTGATTNASITPIYVTIEDDDTRFGQQGSDTGMLQTISSSSDPSLVGQNIFYDVNGTGTQLWDLSSGTLMIGEVRIGALSNWVVATLDGVNTTLSPSTAYNEDDPTFARLGLDYADAALACFTAGTLIATPEGLVPVERLAASEFVLSAEGASAPIRWIGRCDVTEAESQADPCLLPVRIEAGSMGFGLPRRDLLVSRQHRMLLRSPVARRMYGSAEVLIPAVRLVGLPGIDIAADVGAVSYLHILCDRQEVLLAEGCPTESLYLGGTLGDGAAAEALGLFPGIPKGTFARTPARPFAEGKRATKLVARHLRNRKPPLALPLPRQAATVAA